MISRWEYSGSFCDMAIISQINIYAIKDNGIVINL